MLFFSPREVEHLLGALKEHRPLRLRLGDVERGSEDGDLSLLHLFHDTCITGPHMMSSRVYETIISATRTFWFTAEDHTADNGATAEVSAHDLDDADVVDVEIFGIWWHDC